LDTLHNAALDANLLAYNKVAKRFDPITIEARAQKLDVGIWKREALSAVSLDEYLTRRLENLHPLP
jgi:hypothetical protein